MDDLLKTRLQQLEDLMNQVDEDSQAIRKSDLDLSWRLMVVHSKLSNAVSEMHEAWEEEDENRAER
jgi:hypothetical protein